MFLHLPPVRPVSAASSSGVSGCSCCTLWRGVVGKSEEPAELKTSPTRAALAGGKHRALLIGHGGRNNLLNCQSCHALPLHTITSVSSRSTADIRAENRTCRNQSPAGNSSGASSTRRCTRGSPKTAGGSVPLGEADRGRIRLEIVINGKFLIGPQHAVLDEN